MKLKPISLSFHLLRIYHLFFHLQFIVILCVTTNAMSALNYFSYLKALHCLLTPKDNLALLSLHYTILLTLVAYGTTKLSYRVSIVKASAVTIVSPLS